MKEDEGFGLWIWGLLEVKAVAVWAQTTDDGGTWRGGNGVALIAGGDFAVVAHADAGLLTPDKRPPRTRRGGPQSGAFFGARLGLGHLGCGAEFAVDFVLVGVDQELVEEAIGPFELEDVVSGQKWGEAFLPVVMAAFDFAFGLRGWGVAEFDAIEVKGLAELGEGVWVVGVEEGVEVHIQCQWQAVGLEDFGEEVQMGQQGFGGIEACADIEACGVIQDVEAGLFVGVAGQPSMGAGVVLPERAQVASLPAFDGFGGGFVAGVGGELVLDGPAPDAGAVGFEVEPAMEFAGTGAVGRRWFGSEEFFEQRQNLRRPSRMMRPARQAGRPSFSTALGTGGQILGAELVVATQADAQFQGDRGGHKLSSPRLREEMADQWGGKPVGELRFFIAWKVMEKMDFTLCN